MDAVKFIEEHRRMCRTYYGCDGCLAHNDDGSCRLSTIVGDGVDEQIALLEEWSAAHPRKTRQSVFLEQWPNCMIDNDGVVGICPRNIDNKCICDLERFHDFRGCSACRRKFWMQEVE